MNTSMDNRSVGELLRDLANDVARLVREEMALARSEASDKMHRSMAALMSIVGGSLLGLAALVVLLDALRLGLSNHMPDWLAAIIVGGVVAVIGCVLVIAGQKALSASQLAPQRTTESLRKDLNLVREHAS
jgi:Putative Actinobacterial Holin-X, holin superfamily III